MGRYSLEERFWLKVKFTDSCWHWNGAWDSNGYGRFWIGGTKFVLVHRWAYEFCVGPIPEGLEIDHLCRIRYCVNPDHLEVVTHAINKSRGIQEYCIRGHRRSTPRSYCKQCQKIAYYRERLKGMTDVDIPWAT